MSKREYKYPETVYVKARMLCHTDDTCEVSIFGLPDQLRKQMLVSTNNVVPEDVTIKPSNFQKGQFVTQKKLLQNGVEHICHGIVISDLKLLITGEYVYEVWLKNRNISSLISASELSDGHIE